MLRFFRAFARSWFGPVIFGILLIAFGVLGSGSVRGMLGGHISDAVVQAGSHSVSSSQFKAMFERNEQDYQQRTGQPFPLEEAIREGADKGILDRLASEDAYAELLTLSGVRPPDSVVIQELKRSVESGQATDLAQLFDPVTGKFAPRALQTMLANNGLTEKAFDAQLADSVANDQVLSAMSQGFQTPRIFAAVQASLLLQSRDVTYFVIPAASVPVPPKPTDAQLSALMQQFKDRLMLPERRKLTVLRFSAKALAPTMPADPKMVEQQFQANQAKYGKPETRSLIEIPINDPKDAAKVAAGLVADADPEAVAKSVGVDAITYDDQPQAAIADRKAAAAAFQMQAGQVSPPLQGDFKMVILKVTKVTPAQAPDINAAKTQIEADLRQGEAVDKVFDLSNKYQDLRNGGASMGDAAAKLGLTAVAVDPVTADGKDILGGAPNPILSQKLLQTAFQTNQGAESELAQDDGQGEYYVVRVDQVIPPSLPGLDEKGVRPFLTQVYYQQTVVGALQKKAADAVAALKKGQTFEAVAAIYKAQVAHQAALQEMAAQQQEQTLGQAFVSAIFQAKSGDVFSAGSDPLKGLVVARLDAIHAGDPKQVAMVLEALRQRASQSYVQGLQAAMRDAAVRMVKPHTDLDLAHNVMGVDAAMLQRAAKPAPAGQAPPAS